MQIGSFSSMAAQALQGMHAAELDAMRSIEAIAEGDLDHLAENMAQLGLSKIRLAVNMKVMQVVDKTEQDVLDMLA